VLPPPSPSCPGSSVARLPPSSATAVATVRARRDEAGPMCAPGAKHTASVPPRQRRRRLNDRPVAVVGRFNGRPPFGARWHSVDRRRVNKIQCCPDACFSYAFVVRCRRSHVFIRRHLGVTCCTAVRARRAGTVAALTLPDGRVR
jgi:hypothetical protein